MDPLVAVSFYLITDAFFSTFYTAKNNLHDVDGSKAAMLQP
jgi:hypothetical protein